MSTTAEAELKEVRLGLEAVRLRYEAAIEVLSTLVYWHCQGSGHIDNSWWNEARRLVREHSVRQGEIKRAVATAVAASLFGTGDDDAP